MSLGVYVHLPFCSAPCTYCAFAISTDLGREGAYVDALVREIAALGPRPSALGEHETAKGGGVLRVAPPDPAIEVDSIYLGGGTPSRTSVGNLQRIVGAIRARYDIASDAEFSMEANPEDVNADSIAAWRDLGVNRLSIGVQSFNDAELEPLGRVHRSRDAQDAIALAVRSGVRTNLDLILGLPGQTRASFDATLRTAIDLGAGHVSLYMLDIEEKSPLALQLHRGRVTIPDDGETADAYVDAIARLEDAGLRQYEISNFAREGEECRHNIRYWTRGDYRGYGMGAHSFIGGKRFANTRDIRRYIETSPNAVDFSESLSETESRRELLFLGLRQTGGIHYEDVARLCGQEGIEWIDRGLRDGWLRRSGERVAFTPQGFLLSNDLISQLF